MSTDEAIDHVAEIEILMGMYDTWVKVRHAWDVGYNGTGRVYRNPSQRIMNALNKISQDDLYKVHFSLDYTFGYQIFITRRKPA